MSAELAHRFETGLASDVGCRRQVNEDAMLVRPDWGVWAVADGMGGHAAGDFASAAVVGQLGLAGLCSLGAGSGIAVHGPAGARESTDPGAGR